MPKATIIEADGSRQDVLEAEGFQLKVLPFRTTAENLARFFFDCLANMGLPVTQVEVDETPNNRAVYYR